MASPQNKVEPPAFVDAFARMLVTLIQRDRAAAGKRKMAADNSVTIKGNEHDDRRLSSPSGTDPQPGLDLGPPDHPLRAGD